MLLIPSDFYRSIVFLFIIKEDYICIPLRLWLSWLERSPRKRKVGCSNPSRDRPNFVKTGSDSSTAKRSVLRVNVMGPRR